MAKRIAVVIAVLVAAVLAWAARQPDSFRVERTVDIAAPPAQVFPRINDFRRWAEWSPWEDKDPAMERRYGAVTAGEGGSYAWSGNSSVGSGDMRITRSAAPAEVEVQLHFTAPMESRSTALFTLEPVPTGTRVTWAMYGPSNFVAKVMGLVMSMDRMVGGDFERGLARLKQAAEAPPAPAGG